MIAITLDNTDNLERRLGQYQAGECEGCPARRRPVVVAWSQECVTREEALSAEMQIKGWSRKKTLRQAQDERIGFMRGDWAEVSRLANSKSAHPSTGSGRTDLPTPPKIES